MKNILFAFLMLFCIANLSAQLQMPRDTTYYVISGGVSFVVNRVDFSDGTYSENRLLLGDTSVVFNTYVTDIESKANQFSAAAVILMNAKQVSSEMVKKDTLANALLGRSPITHLMDTYTQEFTVGQWTIIYNGVSTKVTFPILSTNKRRRLLPEGGSARTMIVFGNMMRLVNYPITGNNLLFKAKDGLWQNVDKTIVLKKA